MTAIRLIRIIDGFPHWTRTQHTCVELTDSLTSHVHVVRDNVATVSHPVVHQRGNDRRPNPHVRIEHDVPDVRHGEHEPLNQLHGKLARVNRLLRVVVLHVREVPDVTGILPLRVP